MVGDRCRRRVLGLDHLDQRHEIGRVPPMRAEDAVAVRHARGDLADRDDRGVAGEERAGAAPAARARRRSPASAQLLRRRLDDHVGVGDRLGRGRRRRDTRSTARGSWPRSARFAAMRACSVASASATGRGPRRRWPATAKTCAMPWPMRPAPTIAMLALPAIASSRRIAAVGVEDVAGVEVRRPRGEEEQRAGEVLRLAEAALRHAGEEALADRLGAVSLSSNIQAVSGERKTVGAMALTVMPLAPHSQPSALVMPSIADFEAQ